MYKSFTAEEYKKNICLPSDYHIDGMLCYGTSDTTKHFKLIEEALNKTGRPFTFKELPSFLNKMIEICIGEKKYWFDVSYGGALLSEYIHLACLFGSKKNILLGSCGGLDTRINSLDFIIPTASFGNESATRMYNPDAQDHLHHPDSVLSESLKERINAVYPKWEGKTMTCQAMLAETLEDVQNWSQEGYLGVEMEAATVFAVSKHFNVPAAALLFIGDNLIKGETVGSGSYENNKTKKEKIYEEQYRVALEELLIG